MTRSASHRSRSPPTPLHKRQAQPVCEGQGEQGRAIGWEAKSQYRGEPLDGPLKVSVALYWPAKRNHDIDNVRGFLDASQASYGQMKQIVDLRVTKAYDRTILMWTWRSLALRSAFYRERPF